MTSDYIVAKIHIDYRGNSYRRVTSVLLGGQEEGGGLMKVLVAGCMQLSQWHTIGLRVLW